MGLRDEGREAVRRGGGRGRGEFGRPADTPGGLGAPAPGRDGVGSAGLRLPPTGRGVLAGLLSLVMAASPLPLPQAPAAVAAPRAAEEAPGAGDGAGDACGAGATASDAAGAPYVEIEPEDDDLLAPGVFRSRSVDIRVVGATSAAEPPEVTVRRDGSVVPVEAEWLWDERARALASRVTLSEEGEYSDLEVAWRGPKGEACAAAFSGEGSFVVDARAPRVLAAYAHDLAGREVNLLGLDAGAGLLLADARVRVVVEDASLDEGGSGVATSAGAPASPVTWGHERGEARVRSATVRLPDGPVGLEVVARDGVGRAVRACVAEGAAVVDTTAPVVGAPLRAAGAGPALEPRGARVRAGEERVVLPVDEERLSAVSAELDGIELPVAREGGLWVAVLPEGRHGRLTVRARDEAGNVGEATFRDLLVDTTRPVVGLSWADEAPSTDGVHYGAARTARVVVRERNWDPGAMRVVVRRSLGGRNSTEVPSAWVDRGDVHEQEVRLEGDGTYSIEASGTDGAGNAAEPVSCGGFVIDRTPPSVAVGRPEADARFGGVDLYRTRVGVTLSIADRNLDEGSLRVVPGVGSPSLPDPLDWARETAEDGTVTLSEQVTYDEPAEGEAGGELGEPIVSARDLAGNASAAGGGPFVVDRSAPCVVRAALGGAPSAVLGGGSYVFFNRRESLTFWLEDNHLLGGVDASGLGGASDAGGARGLRRARVEVPLAGASAGAAMDRSSLLVVSDLVGNSRTWGLASLGSVSSDRGGEESLANVPIEGLEHPLELVEDLEAPEVALSGAEAGAYYDGPRAVRATVMERNFPYLRLLDPGRVVMRVVRVGVTGEREERTVAVAAFSPAGSSWAHEETIGEDGRYLVSARLVDCAGNESASAEIGEFTIDGTPPATSVSWDSGEARNGSYYDRPRTATVHVTERNFDAGLVSLDTDGSLQPWHDDGDDHWCEVRFAEDGAHHLAVRASDLAGNVAEEVREPDFVVDSSAPSITLGGVAQVVGPSGEGGSVALEDGGAYNGVVAPTLVVSDGVGLEEGSVSYELVGARRGDSTAELAVEARRATSTGEELRFRDLGSMGEEGGAAYDPSADDVYEMRVRVKDLAGNEAGAEVAFSVNRFGSNFVVEATDGEGDVELGNNVLLTSPPTICVREVSVCGIREGESEVVKEYANRTTPIARTAAPAPEDDAGWRLEEAGGSGRAGGVGWTECVYRIGSGNFGLGSDSDSGDGGQGSYGVSLSSRDRAGNVSTTAGYWDVDLETGTADAKSADLSFTLDELGPEVEGVSTPAGVAVGRWCDVEIRVRDDISNGDVVTASADGVPVEVTGPSAGTGTYVARIYARPFAPRELEVEVCDYAGRRTRAAGGRVYVSTLVPEVAASLMAATGLVAWLRRRRGRLSGRSEEREGRG